MKDSIFHMDRKTYINITSPKTGEEFQLETMDYDFAQCLILSLATGLSLDWDTGFVTNEMVSDIWVGLEDYYDLPNIYRIHKSNTTNPQKEWGEEFCYEPLDDKSWEYIPFSIFIDLKRNFIDREKTPTKEYTMNKYYEKVKKHGN